MTKKIKTEGLMDDFKSYRNVKNKSFKSLDEEFDYIILTIKNDSTRSNYDKYWLGKIAYRRYLEKKKLVNSTPKMNDKPIKSSSQ